MTMVLRGGGPSTTANLPRQKPTAGCPPWRRDRRHLGISAQHTVERFAVVLDTGDKYQGAGVTQDHFKGSFNNGQFNQTFVTLLSGKWQIGECSVTPIYACNVRLRFMPEQRVEFRGITREGRTGVELELRINSVSCRPSLRLTLACRRPPIASARTSLRLSAAPEA